MNDGPRRPVAPLTGANEREAFTLLTRSFFRRFFESDLISSATRAESPPVLWLATFLATPGLMRSLRTLAKYGLQAAAPPALKIAATWPDKLFFISWAMATTGLVTVLVWDSLLPDRRDSLILQALPVRLRTSGAARLAALALFFGLMVAAASGPAAIILPTAITESRPANVWPMYVIAHVVSVAGMSAFVFFGLLLIQLLLVNSVNPRWFRRAATLAQSISVVALLALFLVSPPIPIRDWVEGRAGESWAGTAWMSWAPPFWFLGLYETLLGTDEPVLRAAGVRGALALIIATVGAIVLYALTYARQVRRAIEAPEIGRRVARTPLRAIADRIVSRAVPGPVERAVFDFVLTTIARSATHRLIVSSYLGVGAAFVIAGVTRAWLRGQVVMVWPPTVTALGMPLLASFFILAGMRVSFGRPTDAHANWAFRVTESADRRAYAAGVRKAMLLLGGLLPVVCTLPFYLMAWGPVVALTHAWWCLLLARLLTAVLTLRFPRIPFTYLTIPGSANVKAWWPAYVTGFSLYAFTAPAIERGWLIAPSGVAVLLAAALTVEIAIRFAPARLFARFRAFNGAVIYEDEPEEPLQLRLTV